MWGSVWDSPWPFAVCPPLVSWAIERRGPPPHQPFLPHTWEVKSQTPLLSPPFRQLCFSLRVKEQTGDKNEVIAVLSESRKHGPQRGWDVRGFFCVLPVQLILPKPHHKHNVLFLGERKAPATWKVFMTPPFSPLERSAFSRVWVPWSSPTRLRADAGLCQERGSLFSPLHSHCNLWHPLWGTLCGRMHEKSVLSLQY